MSKDNDVYRFIVRYKIAHQGNSPSFSEIKKGCRISSKSVVSDILASLEDTGLLKQDGVKNIEVRNGKWILEEA